MKRGQTAAALGSYLESCEVAELFMPDVFVLCDNGCLFQKFVSGIDILSGISRLTFLKASWSWTSSLLRELFRNANSGAHSRHLGFETYGWASSSFE